MMKHIHIERHRGFYGMFRALKIVVDDKVIGSIRQGKSITLELPNDAREIWGQMDWATTERTNLVDFDLDKTLVFRGYYTFNAAKNFGITEMPFNVFAKDDKTLQNETK